MSYYTSSYGDTNGRYSDEHYQMSSKRKQTDFRYDHASSGTRTFMKEPEPLPANSSLLLNRPKNTRTLPKSPGTRHTDQHFQDNALRSASGNKLQSFYRQKTSLASNIITAVENRPQTDSYLNIIQKESRNHESIFQTSDYGHGGENIEITDLASVNTDGERCQEETLEKMRHAIAILEDNIKSLEAENHRLKNSYAQLEKAYSDDRQRYDQLLTKIGMNHSATGSSRTEYNKHDNTSSVESKQETFQNVRGFDKSRSAQAQLSEHENKKLKEKVGALELQLSELKDVQKLLIEKGKQNEELQKTVNDLKARIRSSDQEIGRLTSENEEQKRRSDSITKQMSLKTESGGRFENLNDECSNINIAQRLKHLYDVEWVNIFRMLGKEFPQMNEFERIKKLSAVVNRCYWESVFLADRHTEKMLMIDSKESGESAYDREEVQEMLTHRRNFCQKEYVRTRVKTNVLAIVMSSREVKHVLDLDNRKTIDAKLASFCRNIIDVCWLVAISHPPMVLNFNAVGRQFKDLEQSWMEFSTKKPLEDMSQREGTIAGVVWPSIELKDGTGIYMKGDVIVVKIGKPLKYSPRHRSIGSPNNNDQSNRGKVYTFDI